jgi:rubrerythrin
MCDIILYQIVVNYLDGEQIVASFEEESVRDAEHENFLSKMVENNCEFV